MKGSEPVLDGLRKTQEVQEESMMKVVKLRESLFIRRFERDGAGQD